LELKQLYGAAETGLPRKFLSGALSGGGQSTNVATELSETSQVVALQLSSVHAVEVGGSEIVKVHAVAQHVVGDDEDAVGHGDPGSFRSATLTDASAK